MNRRFAAGEFDSVAQSIFNLAAAIRHNAEFLKTIVSDVDQAPNARKKAKEALYTSIDALEEVNKLAADAVSRAPKPV